MKPLRRMLPALLLVVLSIAFLAAGCGSKGSDVVATVNGEPITLEYLESKWVRMFENDSSLFPDSLSLEEKQDKALDTVLKKELIIQKAHAIGVLDDEGFQANYDGQYNYRIIELLRNKEIVDKIPEFTEEQLRDHYQYLGREVEARHLDMDSEEKADEVIGRIRSGELSFHEAVQEFSTNPDRESGGVLRIGFGSNIEVVENTLFAMEEGEIADPIRTPYGWSIFILDKTKMTDPAPYEEVRTGIEKRLKTRTMRTIGYEHGNKVLDKFGFKFDWDVSSHVLALMPDDMKQSQLQDPPKHEKPILKFSDEEKEMVLWELDGEKHTLGEYSDTYDNLSIYARPQKAMRVQGIYNAIRRDAISQLMPREAQDMKLDEDPEFVVAMKEFEEQQCISAVKRTLIDAEVVITDEGVKIWYEEHPLAYTRMEAIRCKQLVTREEEEIREAEARLAAGESFDDVGRDLSVAYERAWETDLFTPDSLAHPDNEVFRQILRLNEIGDVTPVFSYQNFWAIYQLTDISPPALLPFDDVKDKARTDLFEYSSMALLDSLLTLWRGESEVLIHEKVLRNAKMGELSNPNRQEF